jgi:hypothetical protein
MASSGTRTVRVTVTCTFTIPLETPTMAAIAHVLQQASQVDLAHTTTRMPFPDVTGVVFQMYEPVSEASQQDQANSSHSKAVTGVILGAVGAVVIIMLLIVSCKGRCGGSSRSGGNRSQAERGRVHHSHDVLSHSRRHRHSRNPYSRRHYQKSASSEFEMVDTYPMAIEYPVPVARPVVIFPSDPQRHQSYHADSSVSPL